MPGEFTGICFFVCLDSNMPSLDMSRKRLMRHNINEPVFIFQIKTTLKEANKNLLIKDLQLGESRGKTSLSKISNEQSFSFKPHIQMSSFIISAENKNDTRSQESLI